MAHGSAFRFAGVVQQPEHRRAPPEVGGKNPPPRSIIHLLPRPHLLASTALVAAIVVIMLAVAGVF